MLDAGNVTIFGGVLCESVTVDVSSCVLVTVTSFVEMDVSVTCASFATGLVNVEASLVTWTVEAGRVVVSV